MKCKKIPIRFWIGCMVFFTAYINYTVKVNLSISIIAMTKGGVKKTPECKKEEITNKGNDTVVLPDYGPRYEWDENLQGTILASYFWGYVLFSLPSGFIAEWLGPFHSIFWMHLISGVVNIFCALAPQAHWGLLLFFRFVIGFCAAPVYPALQCLIARWAPPSEKGKFLSGLLGNTLGTCATWPFVGVITASFGWDWGFYAISMQMTVYLVIFWIVTADSPSQHRWISEEEKNYILESQGGSVTNTRAVPPYRAIFTSLPYWTVQVLHFGNLWGLYLQLTGVPKFINEVVGFELTMAGGLSALPYLLRMFLALFYGWIGDFLKQRNVSIMFIRKFFILFSHIIPGLLLISVSFVGCNAIPIIVLITLSQSINAAVVLTNLANPHDLAPNFAATLFGIMSFIAGMTGFIVPQITGALTMHNNGIKEWGWNFIIGGCAYISAGVFFLIFGSVKLQPWNEKKKDTEKLAES